MVISKIFGGLGNQMFQYAAGRALAMRMETAHLLDISAYDKYQMHQGFELQRIFNCPVHMASGSDLDKVVGLQSSAILLKLLSRPVFSALRKRALVIEPGFNYWNGISEINDDCYLVGYWQTERYFIDAVSLVRSDFNFKLPMNAANTDLAHTMAGVDSISLHVRRGDYVADSRTNKQHGLCSMDYYKSAIRHIIAHVAEPHFFIFSDDPAWVRKNIGIEYPCCYVDHNSAQESYNDMRLMSMCKHHIIANSSFSWWGAWLGSNIDKIIIAPRNWFATGKDVKDLYPEGWVII